MSDDATIGDVFPANDPVAQWVAVLSIGLSDLGTVDARIHEALDSDDGPGAGQYLRWFCGFLHELGLHIRHGRKQEKVAKLVAHLDRQALADEQLHHAPGGRAGTSAEGLVPLPQGR